MAQQQESSLEAVHGRLSWSERRAQGADRKASALLQAEIEEIGSCHAKENRRPTFDDADSALREKLWNEHRARLQRTKVSGEAT